LIRRLEWRPETGIFERPIHSGQNRQGERLAGIQGNPCRALATEPRTRATTQGRKKRIPFSRGRLAGARGPELRGGGHKGQAVRAPVGSTDCSLPGPVVKTEKFQSRDGPNPSAVRGARRGGAGQRFGHGPAPGPLAAPPGTGNNWR